MHNNGLYSNYMSVFYNPVDNDGDGTFETEEEAMVFCDSIDEISEFAIVPVYIK